MSNLLYDGTKPAYCNACDACPQLLANNDGTVSLADSDIAALPGAIKGDKKSMIKFIDHVLKNGAAMKASLK